MGIGKKAGLVTLIGMLALPLRVYAPPVERPILPTETTYFAPSEQVTQTYFEEIKDDWNRKLKNTPQSRESLTKVFESHVLPQLTRPAQPVYITDVVHDIAQVQQEYRRAFDWNAFGETYQLTPHQRAFAQRWSQSITPEMQFSLGLIELMQHEQPHKNIQAFQKGLRYAGDAFFQRPSAYDNLVSTYMYQHIPAIIGPLQGDERSVVAKMNVFLPDSLQLPEGAEHYAAREHHAATVLNAYFNLRGLVKNKTPGELKTMDRIFTQHPERFVQFYAAQHHRPGDAFDMAEGKQLSSDAPGSVYATKYLPQYSEFSRIY